MTVMEKKGRHWVPLLLMTVLALCCTALFYAIPMDRDLAPATPWFSVEEGILYFDQTQYTGGSELTVPAQIDGQTVTAISKECFRGCSTLTSIHLPDTLGAIGEGAFRNCTGLRGIEIPEGVAFIGRDTFSGCNALEAVCISNKLQLIGSGVFDGCTKLRYVYFLGNFREWALLYREFLDPNVVISCDDGKFFPNGDPA